MLIYIGNLAQCWAQSGHLNKESPTMYWDKLSPEVVGGSNIHEILPQIWEIMLTFYGEHQWANLLYKADTDYEHTFGKGWGKIARWRAIH